MKNRNTLLTCVLVILFYSPLYIFSQACETDYLVLVENQSKGESTCCHIELSENIPDSILARMLEFHGFCSDDNYRSILFNSYDEMDIFGLCNYFDKVKILERFLLFQGDKRCSNKTYMIRPGSGKPIRYFEDFTVQIEALYTFTRMLMYHMVTSVPELIDTTTGKTINNDQEKIVEVYEIYKNWLIRNEKSGFKNYRLPLYGTKYKWKGQNEFMDNFVGKELDKPY